MYRYHPKLVEIMVKQTPRAMFALLIVSLVYIWVFSSYVPHTYLAVWFFFQIVLALLRYVNAKTLHKHISSKTTDKIKPNVLYFNVLNLFQAMMWIIASLFSILNAPEPFELITFIMVIGIITAGVLSMSSLFTSYIIFFLSMILPQLFIMYYFGEHHHWAIIYFTLIYIPAILLLSRSLYHSYITTISNNETLEQSVEELHKLSIIDSLTNIYNRRYFFEMAYNTIAMDIREHKHISLIMFDIDHFKDVNDKYGHQTGDNILMSLAKEVKETMRKSDLFARVGGEEFAILLHDTSLKDALEIAEKIRLRVENETFRFNNHKIKITISAGVTTLDETQNTIEALYKAADKKLYQAKKEGRNRVC